MSTAEKDKLDDNEFAFPSERNEPLTGAKHVRNALAGTCLIASSRVGGALRLPDIRRGSTMPRRDIDPVPRWPARATNEPGQAAEV